jgi:succinyl-CoA synthetase alpha subunit
LTIFTQIKPSAYYDSIVLMQTAKELTKFPGIQDAAVLMGTEANKSLLQQNNLFSQQAESATSNDLIIAIRTSGDAQSAFIEAERLLSKKSTSAEGETFSPKTIRSAIKYHPESNMVVISIAGRYAAAEAYKALQQGLHVLLFSDNVSLEDEIALKCYAVQHGLFMMGPGAGTAIINGVGLGFANVLPQGPVGIVSAAGTGLQEVSTLLAKNGIGITQGIGTGGRDLKKEVGGMMMLDGLKALQSDKDSRVIILISKPPDDEVAEKIIAQVTTCDKPTIICFLGADLDLDSKNIYSTGTLEEAAYRAIQLINSKNTHLKALSELIEKTNELKMHLNPNQIYLRGLFSGGTLCYEAQVIWEKLLKEPVFSNAPLDDSNQLPDSTHSQGHSALDLGEEEFTVGRPHPMIDNDLRMRRMLQEAQDPDVAVIMLDVVIGYGAHPDPASELGQAAKEAIDLAERKGRQLVLVASITGTEEDPQKLSRTAQTLNQAGIIVCESNAAAARFSAAIVNRD